MGGEFRLGDTSAWRQFAANDGALKLMEYPLGQRANHGEFSIGVLRV